MDENKAYSIETAKKEMLSDFNEAKLQILRLSNTWDRCKSAAIGGNLHKWNWELDSIWRELFPDATNKDCLDDIEEYPNKIKEINKLIAKYKNHKDALYKILDLKECVLRKLQDKVGKGSKRSSSEDDDIEN